MYFYNSKAKEIAVLSTHYQKSRYGNETMQVKRWHLYELMHDLLRKEGVTIHYGKKAVNIIEDTTGVQVKFYDNTTTKGDLLFGCDGAFSLIRKTVFPKEATAQFTKIIGTGGFAYLPELEKASKGINMTFGERGFFAYAVSNNNEIWWFNNYFREREPTKEEIKTVLKAEIIDHLLDLHKNDDPLFSKIIKASHEIAAYPIYDIPKLEKWHTARVCLIGDAAHATSPHVGQGASLAMEDTVCLIKCLEENANAERAFERFQQLRQPRVEKIIQQARKIGNAKSKPNPIAVWFRDRMLKFFIKSQIKKLDWIYGYAVGK
jgi:2-polyprenyl-6-methoxyphenol hydroxylase-like FAD-dependent oxidoreductase